MACSEAYSNEAGFLEWPEDAVQMIEGHIRLLDNQARIQRNCKAEGTGCNWHEEEEEEIEEEEALFVEDNLRELGPPLPSPSPLVDLGSDLPPLPPGWEQFLNLQTGEIYFMDWKTGKRTKTDPRKFRSGSMEISEGSRSEITEAGGSECVSASGKLAKGGWEEEVESKVGSCALLASCQGDRGFAQSDFRRILCQERYPPSSSIVSPPKTEMVVRGCRHCLHYVMYPKDTPLCPNCRGSLV